MKYIISEPIRCRFPRVTKKAEALIALLEEYSFRLLPDDLSLDAFIEEVRAKAAMLDKEYPRTLPLHIDALGEGFEGNKIICISSKDASGARLVDIDILQIRGVYRYSEPAQRALSEEGGAQ